MQIFRYPRDVVQRMREEWDPFVPREWDFPPLPDDSTLQTILEVIYHASLTSDEQRHSKFSVALCDASSTSNPIVFDQPRDFSVHELMRLAPAGDPVDLPIGLTIGRGNAVKIWGLASGVPKPAPIFAVPGPGCIDLRRYDRTVVSLSRGQISASLTPAVYQGLIAELFSEATDSLLKECGGIMGGSGFNPDWLYANPLFALLRNASRHGHGASIFVVPEGNTNQWQKMLRIKYALNDQAMWSALKRYISDGYPEEYVAEAPESSRNAHQKVMEWPQLMAKLTRVDGGLLITDRFRALGFGVEVVVPAADVTHVRLAKSGTLESIDNYGTRHRSAFRLCHQTPDVVAFVCSQDGGIKAIRNVNGIVQVWM